MNPLSLKRDATFENRRYNYTMKKKSLLIYFRDAIIVSIGFMVLVLVDLTLTEKVKELVAHSINYKAIYQPMNGRSIYYDENKEKQVEHILDRNDYEDDFFEKDAEWQATQAKENKDMAIIHWSGRLFLLFVSLPALLIYFSRRKKKKIFGMTDWIALFFGLFFMRDVAMDALWMYSGRWNHESVIWTYFGLPYNIFYSLSIVIGVLLFFFILYKLPKDKLIIVIIFGFIGSGFGAYFWLNTMAKAHPTQPKTALLQKGDTAIHFSAPILGRSDSFNFEAYKDSILVLDFFFSTCGPCRATIPTLNALNDCYKHRGVVFMGVNPLEKDWHRLDRFLAKVPLHYPVLKANIKVAESYGVRGYPTLFVIHKGRVMMTLLGYDKDLQNKLVQAIETILKEGTK